MSDPRALVHQSRNDLMKLRATIESEARNAAYTRARLEDADKAAAAILDRLDAAIRMMDARPPFGRQL